MKEEEIQEGFVKWLQERDGYVQARSDPNGGDGAICDSIGRIKEKPLLIEFKISITPSIIEYNTKTSTSIERKIRNSLWRLHNEKEFLAGWKKDSIPKIWVVAERINEQSIQILARLLSKRAQEWVFGYEFGVWNGSNYSCLGKGPPVDLPTTLLAEVRFHDMPWSGENRKPRNNLTAFKIKAKENGVGELLDYFLDYANRFGFTFKYNRESINLSHKASNSANRLNAIGIWPSDSSGKDGLCIASDEMRLSACFPKRNNTDSRLFGKVAPNRGFINQRNFLANKDEIGCFWEWATGIKND